MKKLVLCFVLAALFLTVALVSTAAAASPYVTYTNPANGATGVPLYGAEADISVVVGFNQSDITYGPNFGGITMKAGDTVIPVVGDLYGPFWFGELWIYAPTLSYDTTYTVTIPAGTVQDSAGSPSVAYSFSFRTCSDPAPTVVSTDPSNGASGVQIDKTISASFSESVTQGASFSDIVLKAGTQVIESTINLNGSTLTIDPVSNLSYETPYTVTIPAGAVQDSAGKPLADSYTFSFTTRDGTPPYVTYTDPANGATGVPINVGTTPTGMTIRFSEVVNYGPNFDGFTMRAGGTVIPVSPDLYGPGWMDEVWLYAPTLSYDTTYTVDVPAGAVVDSAGNPSEAYSFSFTTPDTLAPMTTIDLAGTQGENGYHTSDVAVTLTATDNLSGVARTEYSFDGTTWSAYTAPFTLSAEGTTTTYYRSVDNAGHTEETKEQVVKIDKTAPTLVSIDPPDGSKNVPIAKVIEVKFSEAIQVADASLIVLKKGNQVIPINAEVSPTSPDTLLITPSAQMAYGSRHTITISAGAVKDMAGNLFSPSKPFTSSFTTSNN